MKHAVVGATNNTKGPDTIPEKAGDKQFGSSPSSWNIMALFNKLFSTGKKRSTSSSTQKCTAGQFPFTTDQIRVILFRECDIRGKKLLFDSSAVERIPDGPSSTGSGSATATSYASSSVHHKSIPQAQKCDHCKVLYQVGINWVLFWINIEIFN